MIKALVHQSLNHVVVLFFDRRLHCRLGSYKHFHVMLECTTESHNINFLAFLANFYDLPTYNCVLTFPDWNRLRLGRRHPWPARCFTSRSTCIAA